VPVKVFERKLQFRGGCVLIDASGSMSISNEMLRAVIEVLPLGTVAYYSGVGSKHGAYGDLVIVSDKGVMYGGKDVPFRYSGNSIDFPALQWLMTQPGPRWFVGDKGWCGADHTYTLASEALLENAKARGMVQHYTNLRDFLASLGIAEIPNR